MSVFTWLVLAVALGVFAGAIAHDLFALALARWEHRRRTERTADALVALSARINEKRRSPLTASQHEHRDGAVDRMRGERHE